MCIRVDVYRYVYRNVYRKFRSVVECYLGVRYRFGLGRDISLSLFYGKGDILLIKIKFIRVVWYEVIRSVRKED